MIKHMKPKLVKDVGGKIFEGQKLQLVYDLTMTAITSRGKSEREICFSGLPRELNIKNVCC